MIFAFLILLFFGPRAFTIVWWIAQPARFSYTFHTFLFPLLGIIFLPTTTLMYVLVYPGGIHGFDWIWLLLALMIDLSTLTGSAYKGKQQIAPATDSTTAKPTPPTTK